MLKKRRIIQENGMMNYPKNAIDSSQLLAKIQSFYPGGCMKKTVIALVITLFLTSCGHKGPLYLPDHPPKHENKDMLP